MDRRELHYATEQVHFIVRADEPDSGQQYLYCCLYRNQEGAYSLFSPYLQVKKQKGTVFKTSIFDPLLAAIVFQKIFWFQMKKEFMFLYLI